MSSKILIVGAGPTGLCLSLALASRGMEVDLVERQSVEALAAPDYDGREIALTRASIRLLRELGVWDELDEDAVFPLSAARIMDGPDIGFRVDATALGDRQLGAFVSNHLIRTAAWRAVAKETRIHVHTDAGVRSVATDNDSAHAWLDDGRHLEASLLVAADSRFSRIRQAMGIPAHMHDFGLSMLLCRIHHEAVLEGAAWEWFGTAQTRALLPLADGLASAILTLPGHQAESLLRAPEGRFLANLAERFEGRLGSIRLASTRHMHPLVATWARRFTGRRFALAGDAAVGMHPVTAHGFNLGLVSIEHLARAIGEGVQRWDDPGHPLPLAHYQRRHRMSSAPMFAGTQLVAGLFTDDRPHAQPLRKAVLQAGRHLPPLRRALTAHLIDETPFPTSIRRRAHLALQVLRPHPRMRSSIT